MTISAPLYPGLDVLATAIWLLNENLLIIHANPAAENLFQLSRRQLIGSHPEKVFIAPAALMQAIHGAVQNDWSYAEQEFQLQVHGKEPLQLGCTVTPLKLIAAYLLLEFRPIDKRLRQAREERLLEQHQANRELIRSLAHEIKNPLGGLRGAAQLLERELDRPELTEYTQVIINEADRLQALVDRLLTPHRLPQIKPTNIHEILSRVRNLILAEFPDAITIHTDFDISLPDIHCDPEQILQAVLNVVRNAAQALQGRGEIWLRTRVARQATLGKRRHRLALALSIQDNGPGIPESIRDKIFFPLVSGREGGSGLGLTIAQTYVTHHHGAIEWSSLPGETCFTILLPLNEA